MRNKKNICIKHYNFRNDPQISQKHENRHENLNLQVGQCKHIDHWRNFTGKIVIIKGPVLFGDYLNERIQK